ncbi:hypothetical protein ACOMHN_016989 [Nucella lapillus]
MAPTSDETYPEVETRVRVRPTVTKPQDAGGVMPHDDQRRGSPGKVPDPQGLFLVIPKDPHGKSQILRDLSL